MQKKSMAKAFKVLSVAALSSMFAFSSFSNAAHAATATPATTSASSTTTTQTSNYVYLKNPSTSTPIQHVVVIFGENVSFDHYFGTYPNALNPKGEPHFHAKAGTPAVNNLLNPVDYNKTQPSISSANLLTRNPNLNNPSRIDRSQPITDDMDHGYAAEQAAFDNGKMDQFVQKTAGTNWPFKNGPASMVMNYYDGNTVTGLWNYAQNFAMDDNAFGTQYGPSTPGALNVISGDTTGAAAYSANSTQANKPATSSALNAQGTDIGDADPYYDSASKGTTFKMSDSNKNIGNLLNSKGVTWGWFEGGFADPTAQHKNVGGSLVTDYSPHHEPFQYYKSTANPNHLAPTSVDMIGKQDQANHQYDLTNFWQAVNNGNMPSVSYLKAPMYQDAHAGYSDPLDEQKFVVDTINKLEKTPEWSSTAVILTYDDSDGWYDHVFGPSNGKSNDSGQKGVGPRLPFMVISPYAKTNYVDHTLINQTSIVKFIEKNWGLGTIGGKSLDTNSTTGSIQNMFDFSAPKAPKVFLDDQTGEVVSTAPVKPTSYSDLSDYATQINYLESNGVVHGYSNGTFKPQSAVTRLQAVEMILNQMNIDPNSRTVKDPGFSDLKPGDYGYQAAAVAANLGLVKGKDNGKVFDPNGNLTRGEMAAILTKAYNLSGKGNATFKDVKAGEGFYNAIDALVSNGVAKGYADDSFRPDQNISREHFSVFLYNYLTKQQSENFGLTAGGTEVPKNAEPTDGILAGIGTTGGCLPNIHTFSKSMVDTKTGEPQHIIFSAAVKPGYANQVNVFADIYSDGQLVTELPIDQLKNDPNTGKDFFANCVWLLNGTGKFSKMPVTNLATGSYTYKFKAVSKLDSSQVQTWAPSNNSFTITK